MNNPSAVAGSHGWLRAWLVTLLVSALVWYGGGLLAQSAPPAPTPSPRYTFSWPLEMTAVTPRGGTTQGPPVTMEVAPSLEWQSLHATGIDSVERDRRAILAMAGMYRTTFDFLEVLAFNSDAGVQPPYQSWGTEKVYVDSDTGRSISLVHILEMRILQNDGSISEPIVMKHWRQDWQYEPEAVIEYRGNATWRRRVLSPSERKGRWLQAVYQVDESPRYASLGAWQHTSTFSSWLSGDTWRPLPRREWSVRKDYDVLIGTNRHTVTATGWVQEENNLKTRLDNGQSTYVAREYGVARYERIKGFSFAEADDYYNKTHSFWNQVRVAWSDWLKRDGAVRLRGHVDQLALFVPLFEHAEKIGAEPTANAANQQVIDSALQGMRF